MKLVYTFLILLCLSDNIHAQIENMGDEMLAEKIKQSDKSYKLIYIFCDYCQISQVRYPAVVKAVQNNKDVEVFFVCAQDSSEVAQYVDTCKVTCKYLKKHFGINSDKMGASDFCVIDKDDKVVAQTNWEMKDTEYFELLDKSLGKTESK